MRKAAQLIKRAVFTLGMLRYELAKSMQLTGLHLKNVTNDHHIIMACFTEIITIGAASSQLIEY